MDQAQIPTLLGLAMNAVVAVLVTISFFRRYATKEDIKDLNDRLVSIEARLGNVEAGQASLSAGQTALETRQAALETRFDRLETRFDRLEEKIIVVDNKADASQELHHAVRGDLKVLQASVNRLESYFETPKLKSS